MGRVNVAVLRGGPPGEYEVSLKTGGAVLKHLPEERYNVRDILIAKDGMWHSHGLPATPVRALAGIDVVFNALHGEYGEGGKVQRLLDSHHIPYTGSGVFGSSIAMDKARTRVHVGKIPGVKMPAHFVLRREEVEDDYSGAAARIFSRMGPPYVLKPLRGGSSVGIVIVRAIHELPRVLFEVFNGNSAVLVEEFIRGKEATCGVVEGLRNERLYKLPPIEVLVPEGADFWDYESKYDGITTEVCPGNFTSEEKQVIQDAAHTVHGALGLRHYSRSD
ncbi:MAG: hypothetical protein Q8P16_02400, partial [bacterium]|nr:hypothetical protein [bacterium]